MSFNMSRLGKKEVKRREALTGALKRADVLESHKRI